MKKLGVYKNNLVNFYLSNKEKIGEEFVLIDSPSEDKLSEYSYLLSNFTTKLSFKNNVCLLNDEKINLDYFDKLREILGNIPKDYVSKEFFTGGTVGLVSYD